LDEEETKILLIREFFETYGLVFNTIHFHGTPRRMKKAFDELLSSVGKEEPEGITVFGNINKYNEMIISGDIQFYSLCSHHFLPFFGKAWIAYIPDRNIVGLSKLARILDFYSKQPQVQETLTQQVADFIDKKLKPLGVAVVIKARHLCTEMRGIKSAQQMTTSAVRGAFKTNSETRQEFLRLIE